VSSLLFGLALLVVLIGLYLWARRRSDSIRQQAAQREQAAMAMVLSAPPAAEKPKQKEVEQIDHAALIRQAHGEAAEQDKASKDLPPIEYDRRPPRAN
jgi:hypothetical protein